jgi:hypothetical protein
MLFFSNLVFDDQLFEQQVGNIFIPILDDLNYLICMER